MERPSPQEHSNVLSTIQKAQDMGLFTELMAQEFYLAYLEILEQEVIQANGIQIPAVQLPNYQHFKAPDAQTSPRFYQ